MDGSKFIGYPLTFFRNKLRGRWLFFEKKLGERRLFFRKKNRGTKTFLTEKFENPWFHCSKTAIVTITLKSVPNYPKWRYSITYTATSFGILDLIEIVRNSNVGYAREHIEPQFRSTSWISLHLPTIKLIFLKFR